MIHLDTKFPTIVFNDYLLDPSIMDTVIKELNIKTETRINKQFYYKAEYNPYLSFICEIASNFLNHNTFSHNKDIWYMDVIRYDLDNQSKPVKSGLAWHCENDNQDDVITVLFYLYIDETVKDGNLQYKDKDNVKQLLEIKSGTTVIMDGEVPHKPQNPYGTGKRDLIIVSFKKQD
jgi:hypothetical protein